MATITRHLIHVVLTLDSDEHSFFYYQCYYLFDLTAINLHSNCYFRLTNSNQPVR